MKDILLNIECSGQYDPEQQINDIAYDSRKARENVMFVCLTGARADGHNFAKSAYDNGCRVFLCEREIDLPNDAQIILCEDTRASLAVASCNLFEHPSKELAVIGITGTKGKTTVAHIVQSVLNSAGIKCGIIGTVGAGYDDVKLPTVNTTPESYELQKMFRLMLNAGCKAVAIEVSSLGLKFHRVDSTVFSLGVFTNLYPDHIGTNEHATFEEYAYWKKQLFPMCKKAIVNIDDAFSDDIISECKCPVVTYGYSEKADYRLDETQKVKLGHVLGVNFKFTHNDAQREYMISMPGDINAHNSLIAVAVADSLGVDSDSIKNGLSHVFVKGRGEIVETGKDYTILIDYAHNGVSLTSILDTVRAYEHNRIIALYGSVGGRTEIRRRELGLVSGAMCDLTIITSDDPDFEDPENIIKDIAAAVEEAGGKYVAIPDRAEAIHYAISIAQKGDILVFAGKGHEEFMKINGEKVPFSEKAEIFKALE
ncbi:MAG: UDP-N-acetylmuramoyl-L-alanyl-D-glutamate--2,6-diaminopimelate ligase [Faecalibacterium sp.]|nr:UDP-N-acetylmuramoyl-L-alanyl-D-glutamate--2,6-diaminopimelate ligase [Ruminococcus sp.]MCM1391738.1 UDP-N-acetylmuramoyl-L-alanyl-D-glutamate--2,6-diaminopimelate ligase [Ruminococcus sp.]MCM1485349.1 UDP-N-acetylmuramoyl-L-alanyl-D-glutamate--2,6-diaminopimelate ligase [Faecalibacterium sp.]